MRQNLQNIRKSPRVADESMVIGGGNLAELPIFAGHDHHIKWIEDLHRGYVGLRGFRCCTVLCLCHFLRSLAFLNLMFMVLMGSGHLVNLPR
ncbi:uncharacterized protein Pyn_12122 [Prunus yedoensis var. nudiflora]|uniref:Uncharacterized protein n=1 Tax=Prunus yedoensis var. nudiflora TaxID=2094558 RepID=A0A314ZM32_PRUYE|nr:uncharacterized protein Pyn_12122 [Prunus yedoensis var. nudiflora]